MAYVEPGEGDPIVFQRYNPTSSCPWSNIMPSLAQRAHCIAVDLMGMGDPDKLDEVDADSGLYIEHHDYLFADREQRDFAWVFQRERTSLLLAATSIRSDSPEEFAAANGGCLTSWR